MKKSKEFQESLEKLKSQITALQKAVNELRQSGLSDIVLFRSLQACSNRHLSGPTYLNKPISIKVIKAVVQGLDDLEEYMFPPKTE